MLPHRKQLKESVRPLAARMLGSVHGARTTDPLVALTFDDGPDEQETPRLLATLEAYGATATFFILGSRARRYPELVRAIHAAGHEVGSHADAHTRLTDLSPYQVFRQVRRSKRDLEAILGEPVRLFRPPFGFLSKGGYMLARSLSLDVVAWSAEAKDWLELPIPELVANALDHLEPGGILLLHDGLELPSDREPSTPPTFDRNALVRTLLDEIGSRGWRSVGVGALIAGRPVDRRLWFRLPAPSG